MSLFDKLFGKKDNIGKKEQADKEKESIEKIKKLIFLKDSLKAKKDFFQN